MKASKIYTAQEMREMADAIINECEDEEAGLVYESPAKAGHIFYPDEASAMLRQAAEMRERAEELKAQCLKICGRETCDHKGDKCVCCARDVIDFIVRGDEETATVATHRDGANDAGKPDLSVSQMAL